jgi:LytS/YehU family sensor histidine kinase
MISRLSELLRHSIDDANEPEITLGRELDLLTRYIEIMQVRFQDRLTVETVVAADLLDALVPNMMLQPLVENAIKHGIEPNADDGRVSIEVVREGETLVLRVHDSGHGALAAKTSGTVGGVGLRNTVARLEQLYGSSQSFALRADEAGGTIAEVRLPYHTGADLCTIGDSAPALATTLGSVPRAEAPTAGAPHV